jgi:cell division protein FtsL
MKKVLFILLCVSALIFAIRNIYASKQPEHVNNIDYVVDYAIEQNEECSHF